MQKKKSTTKYNASCMAKRALLKSPMLNQIAPMTSTGIGVRRLPI